MPLTSLQGTSIAPGDLKFVDVNGDGVINDSDKTEIGNPHPDLTMGLNLDFSWKGFDLNISTYGAFGMQVAHTYRKFGNGQFDNYSSNVYNYWHGEGTSNRYPILLPGNTVNHINISDIYVDDADYFRIQNVTLGYDIKRPMEKLANSSSFACMSPPKTSLPSQVIKEWIQSAEPLSTIKRAG